MLTFLEFKEQILNEASVLADKYEHGHKVILNQQNKAFITAGYKQGDIFELVKDGTVKFDKELTVGKSTEILYIKDNNGLILKLIGISTSNKTLFTHATDKLNKSDTGKLTELKENASMYMIESIVEHGKVPNPEELKQHINDNLYRDVFYNSALKHAECFHKYFHNSGYIYERQKKNLTKELYKAGTKLSGKKDDNWNPADIWLIKKSFDISSLYNEVVNIEELNSNIATAYKEGNVVPISLKQIPDKKEATLDVIDPEHLLNAKLDYDFDFDKVDISNSFANALWFTKHGFYIRFMYKGSSTSTNVYIEGSISQLGAISPDDYQKLIKKYTGETIKNKFTTQDLPNLNNYIKKLHDISLIIPRLGNVITNFKEVEDKVNNSTEFEQIRFMGLVEQLYPLAILSKDKQKFNEVMKHCYFLAKKITETSSMYVILHEK